MHMYICVYACACTHLMNLLCLVSCLCYWSDSLNNLTVLVSTTVEHSYNKPEIPGQSVCYKQECVISGQFPMR